MHAEAQGLKQCLFPDYKTWVLHQHSEQTKTTDAVQLLQEDLSSLKQRMDLAEADLKLKMYESDYDKAEKKLLLKLDEKLNQLKEAQRQDRNDYNNKLATFKADISLVTFDQ